MKLKIALALTFSLLTMAVGCPSAQADETATLSQISVLDTAGMSRASAEVDGFSSIEFNITDAQGAPGEAIEVTLTNQATGEVLRTASVGGKVVFENVGPGSWTVASATPGVTFTSVNILAAGAATAGASGLGLATGLLVGTGAIAAATVVDLTVVDKDVETTPLSPAS